MRDVYAKYLALLGGSYGNLSITRLQEWQKGDRRWLNEFEGHLITDATTHPVLMKTSMSNADPMVW